MSFWNFVIVVSLPKSYYLPKSGYCCLWFSTPCSSHACMHACSHACMQHAFCSGCLVMIVENSEIIFTPPTPRYHLRLPLYERICQLPGIIYVVLTRESCSNCLEVQRRLEPACNVFGGLEGNIWQPRIALRTKLCTVRPILGSSAYSRIRDIGSDEE